MAPDFKTSAETPLKLDAFCFRLFRRKRSSATRFV